MVDPHLMLMLMQLLGKEYTVWDKAATVEFVSPGRGEVHSTISISNEELSDIRAKAENGKAHLPEFELKVLAENGDLVALIKKTLYVKKKSGA